MGKHVLLVEDEPNIIEAIRFLLTRDGWQVDTHADGATATETALKLRPDVIILDLMLPNRSGYEIIQELRAAPDTKETPVLMLTARGQPTDREMATHLGVSKFMAKPFSNSEMLEAVRELGGA